MRIPKQKLTALDVAALAQDLDDFAAEAKDEHRSVQSLQSFYHACVRRLTMCGLPTGPRSLFAKYVAAANNFAMSPWATEELRTRLLEQAVLAYARSYTRRTK